MIHILLIINNTSTNSDICKVLAQEGIESKVEKTDSDQRALHKIASNVYDLVVLGPSSENFNSLKLLQKIKMHHPTQPVLMLSPNNTRSFALQAMRLNAQGYLTHDSLQMELADAVKSIKLGRSYITTALTA